MFFHHCSVNQYTAFGLSGSTEGISMSNADVTVTWVDSNDASANAVDYFLSSRVQVSFN